MLSRTSPPEARLRPWRPAELAVVAVLGAATVTMTIWTVGMSLQLRQHWWQWVGFDAILIAAAALATRLAARRDPRLAVGAGVVAALAFTDGWFDLFSSPQDYVGTALLTALTLEWPFALFCLAVAMQAVRRASEDQRSSRSPSVSR